MVLRFALMTAVTPSLPLAPVPVGQLGDLLAPGPLRQAALTRER